MRNLHTTALVHFVELMAIHIVNNTSRYLRENNFWPLVARQYLYKWTTMSLFIDLVFRQFQNYIEKHFNIGVT